MLPQKLRQQVMAGIDYLATEYKHGRILYRDVLDSREIICATIDNSKSGLGQKQIAALFDKEFDRAFRKCYEQC